VDIKDDDSIANIIKKAKVHLNDIWKDFNEINTSIKLSINLILNSNNAYKISKFENTLTKIDDINSFSIKKFDLNKTVYEIIYNTNPNKLIKQFSIYGFEIVNAEGLWVIQ
jgi:midasin (ATPase involved in ribosome maturation)